MNKSAGCTDRCTMLYLKEYLSTGEGAGSF